MERPRSGENAAALTAPPVQRPPARDDPEAARLYASYGRQLYRFCLARLRSREEAEDAVQNTFLRVHTALQKGVVPQYEAAWLYKIAHNVCLSRREVVGRRDLVETLTDLDEAAFAPAAREERREELHALAEALEALPERLRRVILLREWQGLSYAEIAEELDVSVSAVETLVFRARRKLAAELDQRGTKPARLLDLASALAALKALLSRAGGVVPAKVAAGAAVVAVGGAGVGAGIAVSTPDPARAPGSATSTARRATSTPAAPVAARPTTTGATVATASTATPPSTRQPPAASDPAAPAVPQEPAPGPAPAAAPPAPAPPAPTASGPVETLPTLSVPGLPTLPEVEVVPPTATVTVPLADVAPPLPQTPVATVEPELPVAPPELPAVPTAVPPLP